jgi:hypothetical protein
MFKWGKKLTKTTKGACSSPISMVCNGKYSQPGPFLHSQFFKGHVLFIRLSWIFLLCQNISNEERRLLTFITITAKEKEESPNLKTFSSLLICANNLVYSTLFAQLSRGEKVFKFGDSSFSFAVMVINVKSLLSSLLIFWTNKLECLSTGVPLQPSLMFSFTSRTHPSDTTFRLCFDRQVLG